MFGIQSYAGKILDGSVLEDAEEQTVLTESNIDIEGNMISESDKAEEGDSDKREDAVESGEAKKSDIEEETEKTVSESALGNIEGEKDEKFNNA